MAHAQAAFRDSLAAVDLKPGTIPVFANTTGALYPDDAESASDLLAGQLAQPVEFVAQVEAMYRMEARTFLEVGPDARLTGLVRSILDGREHQRSRSTRPRAKAMMATWPTWPWPSQTSRPSAILST